jgi:hypothetical protein
LSGVDYNVGLKLVKHFLIVVEDGLYTKTFLPSMSTFWVNFSPTDELAAVIGLYGKSVVVAHTA